MFSVLLIFCSDMILLFIGLNEIWLWSFLTFIGNHSNSFTSFFNINFLKRPNRPFLVDIVQNRLAHYLFGTWGYASEIYSTFCLLSCLSCWPRFHHSLANLALISIELRWCCILLSLFAICVDFFIFCFCEHRPNIMMRWKV